ncbi:ArsR/SmtB family transcription factor [Paenibacillus sp. FSL M7-1046]|uniref:ArsR/SmtB family transcription factor n=1 Tax=Paenibacillus sp. FSL M7-1046 TaxID=2975315 RepID=UPI0030F6100B
MNLNIHERLEPVFEILGLLYVSCHVENHKKGTIEDLNKFGLDGEAFYSKHLKIVDKYIHTFLKYRVLGKEADFFFGDENDSFFSILHLLLSENTAWLNSLAEVPDEVLHEEIWKILLDMEVMQNYQLQKTSPSGILSLVDIITFLSDSPLEEGMKWKMLRLLQQPRTQIQALSRIINNNLAAFEQVCQEVEKPLNKLISKYVQSVQRQDDVQFIKLVEMFSDAPSVHPSLIVPLGQVMFAKHCYYGLFVDLLPVASKGHADSKDFLLLRMKALGDNSKLQILASLKVSPKYNLEIADQMGLTAATMSHHMNVLLACGMVGIEKKNGKVYYHLDSDNLRQLITDLEHFLL